MLPLSIIAVPAALLFWSDRSNTKIERARRIVETSEPVEIGVWPCEVGGKLCVDFSRAEDIREASKKFPKCYPVRLTALQKRQAESVRKKILSLRVFNPTRVWIDPQTKEPCALGVEDEIVYFIR